MGYANHGSVVSGSDSTSVSVVLHFGKAFRIEVARDASVSRAIARAAQCATQRIKLDDASLEVPKSRAQEVILAIRSPNRRHI